MKIGFVGLGIMGRPMALNLHAAQHSLVVYDRATLADDIRAAATVEAKPVQSAPVYAVTSSPPWAK